MIGQGYQIAKQVGPFQYIIENKTKGICERSEHLSFINFIRLKNPRKSSIFFLFSNFSFFLSVNRASPALSICHIYSFVPLERLYFVVD